VRTLALDPGERRIGVAITDPTGTFSQPLETIQTRGLASSAALRRISEIVETLDVSRIVVGLPVHMDGREGAEAEAARSFGSAVSEATGVAVAYLDERWTSREAERVLRESGARGRRDAGRADRIAAPLLLEPYLARPT
jgi:putative Holliday junction resolvase